MTLASEAGRLALEVQVKPHRNSRSVCSGCHRKRPGYDRLPPRRFEFVPLWQIAVFFVYAMRRVESDLEGPRRLRARVFRDQQTDPQRLITAE
jgi:hypothetical protein